MIRIAAAGGSLIHPFGPHGIRGSNQTIFREAQIDPETLAIVQSFSCMLLLSVRGFLDYALPSPFGDEVSALNQFRFIPDK